MRFLTLALVFLLSLPAAATHVVGGEITWKRIAQGPDQGKFIFTLVVYYDCNGIQGAPTETLQVYGQNAPISTIPLSFDYAVDLTPDGLISAGNATPCTVVGPYSLGRFQAYYYTSNPVQLNG